MYGWRRISDRVFEQRISLKRSGCVYRVLRETGCGILLFAWLWEVMSYKSQLIQSTPTPQPSVAPASIIFNVKNNLT